MIVSQVQQAAERVVDRPVKVHLLKQPWSPATMDDQGSG
jgi:hypothetical protein